MDIFKKATALKEEAVQTLQTLNLLEILQEAGEVKVVGSLALDLMVYRDIDVEVIVKHLDRETVQKIASKLIKKKSRRIDFSVIDNSQDQKNKFPKGIYLGIKCHPGMEWVEDFSKNEITWKIDIWFVQQENAKSWTKTQEITSRLTDKRRKIILEIKTIIYKDPRYRKIFGATQIYEAVLNNGIENVVQFERYLKDIS